MPGQPHPETASLTITLPRCLKATLKETAAKESSTISRVARRALVAEATKSGASRTRRVSSDARPPGCVSCAGGKCPGRR
jgi:hypothetical protein